MAEPLRILHVVGGLDAGGIESLLMGLYRNANRDRIQFDFVKHSPDEGMFEQEAQSLGARIYLAPKYKIINHLLYMEWWKNFFLEHPEYPIIHGHMRSTASIYLNVAKVEGRITIAHSHSTSDDSGVSACVKRALYRNLNDVADYRFACSEEAGNWLFGNNRDLAPVSILRNGIDAHGMAFSPSGRREVRARFNIDDDSFVIGTVGRLIETKNHAALIHAFARWCKDDARLRLLIVGEGSERDSIEKAVHEEALEGRVFLPGKTNEVAEFLSAMDMFVLPSLHEGFGNVLVEAQCNGLRCIASDTVPEATNVLGRVEFLPLEDGLRKWDTAVGHLLITPQGNRSAYSDRVSQCGYDIADSARRLTDFYLNVAGQFCQI